MGDITRWKCQVCGLTFSRQAAILNHFKLQHRVGGVPQDSTADSHEAQVKEEESGAPVRHIITVETKANLESLPAVTGHSDITWKELGCHLCGQLFKTGKILRAHLSVVHSDGRPFQCGFQGCSYTFKTKGSLKRHQRRHTGERPFACQQCGRRFRESGSLTRHLQSQGSCVSKSDAQIPLYGRTLPLQPLHVDRKPSLAPDLKFNLKQEQLSAEEEAESDFVPALLTGTPAGTVDESKAILRSQIASGVAGNYLVKVEESGGGGGGGQSSSHPMPVCKMEPPPPPPPPFTSPSLSPPPPPPPPPQTTPDNTIDTYEGEEEDVKPPHFLPDILRNSFTCPVCLKSYSRRPSLALHIKQHLDELGDRCSECHRRFTTRQALGRHLSAHSSLRQFECRVCGKTFKMLSHARAHLMTHSTAKSVQCRYCANLYKTKSARNVHERTHTSSPAFPCVECQRAFTTKASLLRHLRTHTGEAPYTCRHCGRTFKEHGTLSRHLRHIVPCSQKARMERELGEVGIHLLPVNDPEGIKDEGDAVRRSDEEEERGCSEPDLGSEEGNSSVLREREEGEEGEWEEEEEESVCEGEIGSGSTRFLILGKYPAAPTFCLNPKSPTGSSVETRNQILSL